MPSQFPLSYEYYQVNSSLKCSYTKSKRVLWIEPIYIRIHKLFFCLMLKSVSNLFFAGQMRVEIPYIYYILLVSIPSCINISFISICQSTFNIFSTPSTIISLLIPIRVTPIICIIHFFRFIVPKGRFTVCCF